MTDYSGILPAGREAQLLLSSCGPQGDGGAYDVASLVLDEGVRLDVRTRYGSNDGTPVDEWHSLVRRYELPGGVDGEWLRAELSEGGGMAGLIERILAGHSTAWDGRNTVGRLTQDGQEAEDALCFMLYDAPLSDLSVWDAGMWLGSCGMSVTALAAELRQTTPEEALREAESDDRIVIRDGLEGMEAAFASILEEAAEADDDDSSELRVIGSLEGITGAGVAKRSD